MSVWSPRLLLLLLSTTMAVGCGEDAPSTPTGSSDPPPTSEPPAEPAPEVAAIPAPEGTVEGMAEGAPVEAAQELDLLHAVPTEVAVSSAYRDRERELDKLFDGDLETAYNSATDALVGTWIDVRIPEGATVTAIEMTAGFTHVSREGTDLFTGNHRVESVRVSRDGEELTTHAMNVDERGLQRIPVEGGAGVYRVEVTAVRPGTNDRWRETCISELRVLGRAPGAAADTRAPLVGLETLPTREAATPPDREGFDAAHRRFLVPWSRDWGAHEEEIIGTDYIDTGVPLEEEIVPIRARRASLLGRLHDFVLPIDAAIADRLRVARNRTIDATWPAFEPDLQLVETALERVAVWASDPAVRCRTDQALAHMRLRRTAQLVGAEWMNDEMEAGDPEGDPGPDVTDLRDRLGEQLVPAFTNDPGTTSRRVLALTLPSVGLASLRDNWTGMRTALETAQRSCGW